MGDINPIFGHYGHDGNVFQNKGPWPGGPVPTAPDTWGGVKGKYEGKK